MLKHKIAITLAFAVGATWLLTLIHTHSSALFIPAIVALLTKYTLGDWDYGYAYTYLDIFYWGSVAGVSYGLLKFLGKV
jgi:hypothetical protein